jgi:hypothetical protein
MTPPLLAVCSLGNSLGEGHLQQRVQRVQRTALGSAAPRVVLQAVYPSPNCPPPPHLHSHPTRARQPTPARTSGCRCCRCKRWNSVLYDGQFGGCHRGICHFIGSEHGW